MEHNIYLTVKNLQKSFLNNIVLKDINFNLKKGEILSLVGENGAGKSTLLKIISGVYPYGSYSGEIVNSDNKAQQFNSVKDANTHGISMIYQEISVEYDLTVAENIMLGVWHTNRWGFVKWKALKEDAKKILERLNFDIEIDRIVRTLSASQQQIICIARALMKNPKILILDEPTASLTENETKILFQIINNLKNDGISCIYISHRLSEIIDISDRIIVLRDGHIISTYHKNNCDKDKIINDMIGKNLKVHRDTSFNIVKKNPVLEIQNLILSSAINRKHIIIEGINFNVYKGEVLGIAGTLGSGRSEILRAIYGAYPKIDGIIKKNGQTITINNPKDAIMHNIGFLTEERKKDGYIGTMNIRNNASLNILETLKKWMVFLSFAREKEQVYQYLQAINYRGPTYDSSILSLSGGNQQKVIFSKILMAESDVLLLDEPTRGIDVGAKDEIYQMIEDLRNKGISFIVVSSELPELVRLCSRVIVLYNKKINGNFEYPNITEQAILHSASFTKQ